MRYAALALAALAALLPVRAASSGATFVAASANPGATFTTAADFNTVAVTLSDPGTMRGTVTLSATAASDRGIAKVTFQTAPAGTSTWTDACTATAAPYTCAFDTTKVADGLKDVRAVATDSAGYIRTATIASRRVDNTAPTVALSDPGTPLTATKTLTATASDGGSGLATVALQYRPAGGATWTTICAAATCAFNTRTLPDGAYDLRALATDAAGNSAAATVADRTVDNTAPTASLSLPAFIRGTFAVAATTGDGNGSGVAAVVYEFRPNGSSAWTTACAPTTAPFTCTGDSSAVPDGLYDVRATATDGAGLSTTTATATTRVDNTAPAVTLADPGSPLSGTVTLTATASDSGSGMSSVRFEAGGTTLCTDTAAPYTCALDTTTLADGLYDVRAVATDAAGNASTSTVTNRRVDNNGPTVALTDPGSPVRRAATIAATASDPAGVASVTIQRKLTSGGTWTILCAAATCSLSALAEGTYDFRALATDTLGHSATSVTLSARTVDGTAPTGTDVQAVNGTGTAGKIDQGDVITFKFSEAMAPASILAGWTGAATAVTVRVNDAGTLDTLAVYDAGNATKLNLGDLALKADRTTGGARFAATMAMSGSSITITLGAPAPGGSTKSTTSTTRMVWTPSAAATDLAGNAMSATAVTETGTDVDF